MYSYVLQSYLAGYGKLIIILRKNAANTVIILRRSTQLLVVYLSRLFNILFCKHIAAIGFGLGLLA